MLSSNFLSLLVRRIGTGPGRPHQPKAQKPMKFNKKAVAAVGSLLAAGAISAAALAPTANAYPSTIRSYVWWSGVDCILVGISNAPGGFGTSIGRDRRGRRGSPPI
jgi:hypothetical protein